MQIVFQLLLFILCCYMFKAAKEIKLAILILASICFDSVIIPYIPFGRAKYILSICFFLSELPYIVKNYNTIKHTILKPVILTSIIATIILAINSPHYNNLIQYIRISILELFAKYFVICYAFLAINEEKKLKKIFSISYYGLLLLTFFAILNYVTKHGIFIDEMLKGRVLTDIMEDAGSKFTFKERFRVQAMFFNPFDYGYICIILLLFFLYGYSKSLVSKKCLYISISCCIMGIITCGCRTNMLCAMIGIIMYVLFAFNLKKKIKYMFIGLIGSIILVSSIPALQDKISETMTVFDKNSSNVGGSSIEMRIIQYTAVLYHIKDHELFGRGLDYFNIDLGWGEGKKYLTDKDLWGLEGVVMSYLLERGVVGVLFHFFFYISLLIFIYKNRKIDKSTVALGIATLTSYLAFSNMTGELSSVFPTLLIAGCCIKLLYLKKQKLNSRNILN